MLRLPVGVPNDCLLSAVLPDSADMILKFGTLHEICGCLISTKTVQLIHDDGAGHFQGTHLAHYTVKEFLFSDRLRSSELSYFSLSVRDAVIDYLNTVLRTCMKLDLSRKPSSYFYESFTAYCRKAAQVAPYDLEDILVKQGELWSLQLSFLNNPRFPKEHFDIEEEGEDVPLRFLCWERVPSSNIQQQALILLSMMEDHLPMMATRLLAELDLESVLSTPLMLTSPRSQSIPTHFLEALSFTTIYHGVWMRDFILQKIWGRLPSSIALLFYVAGHLHGAHVYEEIAECSLLQHVQYVANLNGSGLRITPLQLAVVRWDYAAVILLLKAGALPNAVGWPMGKDFAHIDSEKGSWSALHIIRNSEFCLKHIADLLYHENDGDNFTSTRYHDRGRIEQLLIQHGAEDFVLSEAS
jgi:hypothetical protein